MQDIPFEVESDDPTNAVIKVFGAGGGGSNAVDSMIRRGIQGVEYFIANTDARALALAHCPNKIQIGKEQTNGLGSGSDPTVGMKAAEDATEQIRESLEGADMVFLTAGLGGGTGTGASPVIARVAKELGALTVAIMTKPFRFEGPQRMRRAMQGLEALREYVDTVILISNDCLLEVIDRSATLVESFEIANGVLCQGVESISDLIAQPGLINVDFADVRSIMGERGGAVMGIGTGRGEQRAVEAVNKACSSPLLDKIVIDGAQGVLISIAGGSDLKLFEVNEAMTLVYEKADPDANIICGAVIDDKLEDEVRVTIIATGFMDDEGHMQNKKPAQKLSSPASPVSLKSKLASMMGNDSDDASEESVNEEAEDLIEMPESDNGEKATVRSGELEIEIDGSQEAAEEDEDDTPAYLRKKELLD